MSDFSLTLVLRLKTSKIINDMAKVSIKSEKITPFGGIFHVRELYSRYVGPFIDKVLGLRWRIAGQSPDPQHEWADRPCKNGKLYFFCTIFHPFERKIHLKRVDFLYLCSRNKRKTTNRR